TNMAGRGTDIVLGRKPEILARQEIRKRGYTDEQIALAGDLTRGGGGAADREWLAKAHAEYRALVEEMRRRLAPEQEEVRALGGLHIIGTERHESRRIDNQLRGRAGRQGDPGSSRFYVSLEDDLMRLFGSERI